MAYALFSGDDKISRSFDTEADLWKHADENGLVMEIDAPRGGAPRRVLEKDYQIRECSRDAGPEDDADNDMAHRIAKTHVEHNS